MSRRTQLVPRDEGTGKNSQKPLTLQKLQQLRVIVPPTITAAGLSVVFRVLADGRLEGGMVETAELPPLTSIEDIQKLSNSRRVVAGIEATLTKQSVAENLKTTVATALVEVNKPPVLKPAAQGETLKAKLLTEKLKENYASLEAANPSKEKELFLNWIKKSILVLSQFVVESQLTSQTDDKLSECLRKSGVPRWIFTKFSEQKYPDLSNKNVLDIVFPRKLEKGFTYNAEELLFEGFTQSQGPFSKIADYLKAIVEKAKLKRPEGVKLYVPPVNYRQRILDADSLPRPQKTMEKPTLISIALCNMIVGNYEPLMITEANLIAHSKAVTTDKNGHSQLKTDFKYLPDDIEPMKAQYLKWFEDITKPVVKSMTMIHVTSLVKTFGQPLPDGCGEYLDLSLETGVKVSDVTWKINIFDMDRTVPSTVTKEKIVEMKKNLPGIKAVAPKEFRGASNTVLTPKAKAFVKALTTSKSLDPTFAENVTKFLRTFYSPIIMDMAVTLMDATLQSREIVYEQDDNDPEPGAEKNDDGEETEGLSTGSSFDYNNL